MARTEIPDIVINAAGTPVAGASVQVNLRGSVAATVYQNATGASTLANPLTTDANGRITGWLEEGSYDLVVTASGLATYTQYYESVSGATAGGTLLTTTGDILVGSFANTPIRLATGASTTVLHGGTIPSYSGITGADVLATASIALNRLAIAGTPSGGTKFLDDTGTWSTPTVTSPTTVSTSLSSFTSITATTEATANVFATLPSFVAGGTTSYVIDAQFAASKGSANIDFVLKDTATAVTVGWLGGTTAGAGGQGKVPMHLSHRITPTAASHVYTLCAYVDAGTGTAGGSTGGPGSFVTGYVRVFQG